MEPMIAGLGPLFSSAKLGSLIDVNGRASSWYYSQGRYYWDNHRGWRVTNPTKVGSTLPIAVLLSSQTGSSGEAVAISFLRNAKTRTFGCPTWGLTTGNSDFKLRDGAAIYLASTIMADRDGNSYRGSIAPDVSVNGCADKDVRAEALRWLNEQ